MAWVEQGGDWQLAAGCQGKRTFASMAQAERAVRRSVRSDKRDITRGFKLAPYRCRFCQRWHVGNSWRK